MVIEKFSIYPIDHPSRLKYYRNYLRNFILPPVNILPFNEQCSLPPAYHTVFKGIDFRDFPLDSPERYYHYQIYFKFVKNLIIPPNIILSYTSNSSPPPYSEWKPY